MMRKIKIKDLAFLFIITMVFSGCKKLTEFKVYDSSEFVVPGNAIVSIPVLSTTEVSSSSSFQFKNNRTDAEHVKEIKLEKLLLTITQPAGKNFSFLNSIHIYISASGLPEVQLAYLDNIPSTVGSTLDLITTGVRLDAYIKKATYHLRVETVTDETLTQDVTIRSDMTFDVRAKLL